MNCQECQAETINPKFCSRKCAALSSNRLRPKGTRLKGKCKTCDTAISKSLTYCKPCLSIFQKQPRRRYNSKKGMGPIKDTCNICGIKNERQSRYCTSCYRGRDILKSRNFKLQCVEYKGGKCESCGYNQCTAALDFHHVDPTQKDFNISNHTHTLFDKRITDELDKCKMYCANCHREEHHRLANERYPIIKLSTTVT